MHMEALELKRDTLTFRQRVLPADHPNIAFCMNNLAWSYSDLGMHKEALEYFIGAKEIFEASLLQYHPVMQSLARGIDVTRRHLSSGKGLLLAQTVPILRCGLSSCLSPVSNPMRCGGCDLVPYCSKACQVAHWKEHKKACKEAQANSKKKTGEAV